MPKKTDKIPRRTPTETTDIWLKDRDYLNKTWVKTCLMGIWYSCILAMLVARIVSVGLRACPLFWNTLVVTSCLFAHMMLVVLSACWCLLFARSYVEFFVLFSSRSETGPAFTQAPIRNTFRNYSALITSRWKFGPNLLPVYQWRIKTA